MVGVCPLSYHATSHWWRGIGSLTGEWERMGNNPLEQDPSSRLL